MARFSEAVKIERHAQKFAALGDPVRLTLVSKLVSNNAQSITELTEGTKISRQAVTKHLRILEDVGLVSSLKKGRESLYELDAKPLSEMQQYLQVISEQWDQRLNDLKSFLEKD